MELLGLRSVEALASSSAACKRILSLGLLAVSMLVKFLRDMHLRDMQKVASLSSSSVSVTLLDRLSMQCCPQLFRDYAGMCWCQSVDRRT